MGISFGPARQIKVKGGKNKKTQENFFALALCALMTCLVVPAQLHAYAHETGQWINHLDFLSAEGVEVDFTKVGAFGGGLEITTASAPVNSFVE